MPNVPPSDESLARKLHHVAATRFEESRRDLADKRQQRRTKLLRKEHGSPAWIFGVLRLHEEFLVDDAREWINIYEQSASDFQCSRTAFTAEQLGILREDIMSFGNLSIQALQDYLKKTLDSSGSCLLLPEATRFDTLRGKLLGVVLCRCSTLQAESEARAAIRTQQPEDDYARVPKPEDPPSGKSPVLPSINSASSMDRRAEVNGYIEEVFRRTGRYITRTEIWKSARYKSRTEFERWQRNDRRATKTADQRFTRILSEKPHLR